MDEVKWTVDAALWAWPVVKWVLLVTGGVFIVRYMILIPVMGAVESTIKNELYRAMLAAEDARKMGLSLLEYYDVDEDTWMPRKRTVSKD